MKFSANGLHAVAMHEYTRSQLALRNGQDKPQVWVAFRGIIYDVTDSRLWRDGKHYEHWAGQDLTEELADAPHTDSVFAKFTVVGKLAGTP
ncbi:cytochrome b5 domain-containing protein [Pedobacter sp. SYP-B3415]|uniref:cytochrome b5 domain-containing protein n=1 Tax=Pedobacter sp. SYP-B3415 TaxID=2496641 RepID=UPI001F0DA017|nr:cytochrome b5 domain-containing protein [Pedobacter sp. SYP-B3415]